MKSKILIIIGLFYGFNVFPQDLRDTLIQIDEVQIVNDRAIEKERKLIICTETLKIDSTVLNKNATSSLSELLAEQSHIFIKSYGQGSVATASVRGADASQTQVLWNGILLNNPMNGQTDLSLIPISFIDEIEIASGGNSMNTVGGAVGGSINLISVIRKNKFFTKFIQTAGSFGTFQTFADIGGGTKKFKTDFKIFREQSQNDFTYLNTANGLNNYEKQQNADYVKSGLLNQMYLELSDKKFFTLNSRLQTGNRNIPPIMSYDGSDRDENQTDNSVMSILTYNSLKKNSESKLSAAYTSENINYFLADHFGSKEFVRVNSVSNAKQITLNHLSEIKINPKLFLKTNLDLTYRKAFYLEKKTETGYEKDRKKAELLISGGWRPSPYFALNALLRINNTDFVFLPLMPLLGIEYRPIKNIPLRFSNTLSRNYHNPSLNDLYWIPGGNPDLKAEESNSTDFNANYTLKKTDKFKAEIKTSVYASVIHNRIVWQPGEYGFWTARNIGKVFSRGLETSLHTDYKHRHLRIGFTGNYSYTRATNRSETDDIDNSYDKQLIYIPIHKANTNLDIRFYNYFLRISDMFTGQRFTNSSEEESRFVLPAYNSANLNFGKKFRIKQLKFETEFEVNNLFNTDYQEILWRAMPGRNFLLKLKFEFVK